MSPFVPSDLPHFRFMFSEEERKILEDHGERAEALASGAVSPSTDRQEHFVRVCRSELEPQTNFEFLWIRLRDARLAESTIAHLQSEMAQIKEEINRLSNENVGMRRELLANNSNEKKEIEFLRDRVRALGGDLTHRPGKSEESSYMNRKICSICGGDGGAGGRCFKCFGTGWS